MIMCSTKEIFPAGRASAQTTPTHSRAPEGRHHIVQAVAVHVVDGHDAAAGAAAYVLRKACG